MIEAPPRSPVAPHRSTARELKERLDAERTGRAHLVHRDPDDQQVITWLDDAQLTVGRRDACGLCLGWDNGVSRLHAELELVGEDWTLVDDGLSRNGSFVNGKRVVARQRL